MDKGAHFFRCDFQVHSPRDTNWVGERPVTEDERNMYARVFVSECRERGLDAVAITDHHDFGFFPFIKNAAREELDGIGNPYPSDRQLVVFPGMELTLGVPCQALLILDADFPIDLFAGVYALLNIVQNDPRESQHIDVQPLDGFKDLGELHNRLFESSFLRRRFILLPNVTPGGGHGTLRRGKFQSHYKSMPCVGGYIDCSIEKLQTGDWNIFEGKSKEYNFKPLGIIPTGDNRNATYENLGRNTAWVKWTVPTAEALKQACLARQTRILHEQPKVPTTFVKSLHVSHSKFLGDVNLDFNSQFNSLIGGRGTGKSTILEYLRWALCDQPPQVLQGDELPDVQRKRANLIENTLRPYGGVVAVDCSLGEVRHVVRRHSETGVLELKVGQDVFEPCTEEQIRELLNIQAYSQKQLSSVSVRTEELRRFITVPIQTELSDIESSLGSLKSQIRSNYELIQRKRTLQKEILRHDLERRSQEQQVGALKKQVKNLSEQDKNTLNAHGQFLQEQSVLTAWERDLEDMIRMLEETESELLTKPTTPKTTGDLPNADLLNDIRAQVDSIVRGVSQKLVELLDSVREGNEDRRVLGALLRKWRTEFGKHGKEYASVANRESAQESLLKQIVESEERLHGLREVVSEKEKEIANLGNPEVEFQTMKQEWRSIFQRRGDLSNFTYL